jgi:predicted RNase H-like HicB family nuclease
MKRTFTATVWREDDWCVAQYLEVDVASQDSSRQEALANLREALELYFKPLAPVESPEIETVEVEIGAA